MEVTSTQALPTQTTPTTVSQIQAPSSPSPQIPSPPTLTKMPQIPSPPTQSRTELKLGRKVFRIAIKSNPTTTNNKTLNDCLTGFLKQRISAYLSNPKDPTGIWLSNSKAISEVISKDNSEVVHEVNSEVIEVISEANHVVNPKYNLTNDSHPNQTQ